jgi:hypothetical protein
MLATDDVCFFLFLFFTGGRGGKGETGVLERGKRRQAPASILAALSSQIWPWRLRLILEMCASPPLLLYRHQHTEDHSRAALGHRQPNVEHYRDIFSQPKKKPKSSSTMAGGLHDPEVALESHHPRSQPLPSSLLVSPRTKIYCHRAKFSVIADPMELYVEKYQAQAQRGDMQRVRWAIYSGLLHINQPSRRLYFCLNASFSTLPAPVLTCYRCLPRGLFLRSRRNEDLQLAAKISDKSTPFTSSPKCSVLACFLLSSDSYTKGITELGRRLTHGGVQSLKLNFYLHHLWLSRKLVTLVVAHAARGMEATHLNFSTLGAV